MGLALEIKAVQPFPGAKGVVLPPLPCCSYDISPSSSHTADFSTHSTALPIFLGRTRMTTTSKQLQRAAEDLSREPSFQLTKQERFPSHS